MVWLAVAVAFVSVSEKGVTETDSVSLEPELFFVSVTPVPAVSLFSRTPPPLCQVEPLAAEHGLLALAFLNSKACRDNFIYASSVHTLTQTVDNEIFWF